MASESIRKPAEYLSQADLFAALRARARKTFWENRASPDDLPVIREIIRIAPSDPRFAEEVSNSVILQQTEKVEDVIRTLMDLAPKTPKRASGTFTFTRPPEEPDEKETLAAELADPLTDLEAFEQLAAKARGAIQRKSLSGMKEALAKQFLSAQLLLEQCMALPAAVERCLGKGVQEKLISDYYLPQAAADKPAARKSVFHSFIQELEKEEPAYLPAPPPKTHHRHALPGVWKRHSPKSHSLTELPVSPKATSRPFQRSKTLIALSAQLQEYPVQLQDPSLMRQMLEGAVLLRYLFQERHQKLFKSKNEQRIITQLIELGIMHRYAVDPYPVCLECCLKPMILENRSTVEAVFEKLLSKHTISKIKKAPKIPMDFPLPKGFSLPPFDQEASADSFLGLLAYSRFKLAGCYSQYSKEEKRIMNLLLIAGQIRDMIRLDLPTSLKVILSQSDPVQDADLETLVIRANLGQKPVSESFDAAFDGEGEINRLLRLPYLQHPRFFTYFIDRVQMCLPTASATTVRVGELLLAVASRLKNEPLTLDKAVQSSFTLKGLERLFHSENTAKNISLLENALANFSPPVFARHTAFDTAEAFSALLLTELPALADAQTQRVHAYLQTIRIESEPDLPFGDAVKFYFNYEKLRVLFESENDHANSKELARCINRILKREDLGA